MKRASAFIALTLAVAALAACHGGVESREPSSRAPVAVTSTRVAATETAERLEAGGIVAAENAATLSSRIVAPVVAVRVRAGDRVRRGDVLVALDAREIADQARQAGAAADAADRALAQARSQAAAAAAEHTLAAAWHARITALHGRNSATSQERDEAEARLAGASARVAGAAAAVEQAEASLAAARAGAGAATTVESFALVRAPFDGLVTERLIDPGSLAAPGIPLLRLESSGGRHVEVRVDEARAAFIRPGDAAELDIEGRDEEGGQGAPVDGRVTEVARAISADQRAFTVKVALPPHDAARTGTFVRVWFRGPQRRALVVPASAVRRHGQIASVFVVERGVARLRLVQTGESAREGVTVLAGLDAGEVIVTSPPAALTDGQPVAADAASARAGGER